MARKIQTCIISVRLAEEHGEDAEESLLVPLIEDLEAAVEEAECGEFDREEFDGRCHRLIFIGPDAEELCEVLEGVVAGSPLAQDSKITQRFGSADDPDAEEVELEF